MGMPTEFMTPTQIAEMLQGGYSGLISSEKSLTHNNLPTGSVTDDTEQVLYLLHAYRQSGQITIENTVQSLSAWVVETDAIGKRYIGPSSLKALKSIQEGADPLVAGQGGTTCGGIMRVLSAILFDPKADMKTMEENIYRCLVPTHNTSEALEAAGAYGYALRCALDGGSFEQIFQAAEKGGAAMMNRVDWFGCAASSVERLKAALQLPHDRESVMHTLFYLWGTGLPSADVCGAVFAIFAYAKADVWEAIKMAAELGGDTDTIAALAAALCTAYAGGHNIPEDVVDAVMTHNAALFASKLGE